MWQYPNHKLLQYPNHSGVCISDKPLTSHFCLQLSPINSPSRSKPQSSGLGSAVGKDELSASRKRIHVQVTGMSCSSCVSKIERHLKKQPGEVLWCTGSYILDLSDYSLGGGQITCQPKVKNRVYKNVDYLLCFDG